MSIVLELATFIAGDITQQRASNRARLESGRADTAAAMDPKNLIGGIGYGPAGYSPLTGQKTAIRQRMEAPIDVATPVSITPDQPIRGEQQQYQNLVTKPMFTQTTSAQIAQAEPTRMVMQTRQSMRRVAARRPVRRAAVRRPVRRVARKPVRRIVRRGTMKRATLARRRIYR